MKLATTLLIALSVAVASAATTTYNPLVDSTLQGSTADYSVNGGALTENGGWGHPYSYVDIDTITLLKDTTLTFSYDIDFSVANAAYSVALVGSNKTIVTGYTSYNGQWGEKLDYNIMNTANEGKQFYSNSYMTYTDGFHGDIATSVAPGSYTVSGVIAWDEVDQRFEMALTSAGNTVEGINLGMSEGETISRLVFSIESAGNTGSISDLSLSVTTPDAPSENIPEPTTATLSLLALAGLAARRRRK